MAGNSSFLIDLLEEVAAQCSPLGPMQVQLPTQPCWSDPPGLATTQLPAFSMPAAAQPSTKAKKPRKRGPTTVDQVKVLEVKLKELKLKLKQETISNTIMNARISMLELIIAVKDEQVARIKEINDGLKHNPFAAFGNTLEEVATCSPGWLADRMMEVTSQLATKLSAIMSVLQTQPDVAQGLMEFYDHHAENLVQGKVTVEQLAAQYSSSHPHVSQKTAHDFGLFLHETDKIRRPCVYAFFIAPRLHLLGSKHVESLDKELPDLVPTHDVSEQASQSAPAAAAQASSPHIATEAHWRAVASQVGITDQQRLKAHVLWEIICRARAAVMQQRASLSHAMSQALCSSGGSSASTGCMSSIPSLPPASSCQHQHQPLHAAHSAPQLQQFQPLALSSQASVPDNNQTGVSVYRSAEQWLHEAQCMDKLNKNVIKERCLVALAGEVLLHRVFNTLQFGILLVVSFPFIVDDLAILHAIAEQFNPETLAAPE